MPSMVTVVEHTAVLLLSYFVEQSLNGYGYGPFGYRLFFGRFGTGLVTAWTDGGIFSPPLEEKRDVQSNVPVEDLRP
jgi:hypothetical protein